jgi:hypothetical protein
MYGTTEVVPFPSLHPSPFSLGKKSPTQPSRAFVLTEN